MRSQLNAHRLDSLWCVTTRRASVKLITRPAKSRICGPNRSLIVRSTDNAPSCNGTFYLYLLRNPGCVSMKEPRRCTGLSVPTRCADSGVDKEG